MRGALTVEDVVACGNVLRLLRAERDAVQQTIETLEWAMRLRMGVVLVDVSRAPVLREALSQERP